MRVHFTGIGGAGTSAAAALAKQGGFEVSGCDTDKDSGYIAELKKIGVKVEFEHSPSHIRNLDFLVVSNAIEKVDSQNSETAEAKKTGLRVLTTEEFLAEFLVKDKFLIAVAGTHGKSTTTAMIGQILEDAGLDPTVYVGTLVNKWGRNYRAGKSKYFVIEADEYEDKFLNYHPNIGVITNIDYDHPDYFQSEVQVVESFAKFVGGFKEGAKLILGTEPKKSKNISELLARVKNITSTSIPSLSPSLTLQIPGEHNILNAQAAYLCAKTIGIKDDQIKESLSKFSGTSRRFEFKGEASGVKVFDDYAHHPSEISATLSAVREKFPKERLWVAFQPHTFSRTEALFPDFVKSFEESSVDKLILVDIYASREKDEGQVTSFDLANAIKGKKAAYVGGLEEAATYLAKNVAGGDVVIAMGAGDIYKLSQRLIRKLEGQNGRIN